MWTDHEIIALFFARSEQAITAADEQYGLRLRKLAYRILQNNEDAEDSVSDTYLAAWNAIPPAEPDPLGAYLLRITRNISIAKYHQRSALKRNSRYDVALDELAGCLAAPETVEDTLTAAELTAALNRFLGGLNRERRILFVRRYWFGDSVEELAERFSCTPNTISARLLRLRKKLKRELEKEGLLS